MKKSLNTSITDTISSAEEAEKNSLEDAIKIYKTWIESTTSEEVWAAYFNIGILFQKQNNLQKAKEYFEIALLKNPNLQQAKIALEQIDIAEKKLSHPHAEKDFIFTIIIPTHNRPTLLKRALLSILSSQTSTHFEIIVISDVLDSDTAAICDELLRSQDTYIRRSGAPGPSESRNLGLKIAKGNYILFLDDDDAWTPDFLDNLSSKPEIKKMQVVYFDAFIIEESRGKNGPTTIKEKYLDLSQALNHEIYIKNQLPICCLAFPKHILDGVIFDFHMKAYEDWEFLLCIYKKAKFNHISINGPKIFQVADDTTDRRGQSNSAKGVDAILDYIYTYRRHPAPTLDLKQKRSDLLKSVGFPITAEFL